MCVYIYIYMYTHTLYINVVYVYAFSMYIHVYIHTHTHTMEYYSAIKKNKILPFAATWVDLEGIMLSEISQTEKDKYCMISVICGI